MGISSQLTLDQRRSIFLMLPPFGYAVLLLALPLLAVILFSFWTQDFMSVDTTFTLDNYREIAEKPVYGLLLQRSLMVSGIVTVVTVLLAFPVAVSDCEAPLSTNRLGLAHGCLERRGLMLLLNVRDEVIQSLRRQTCQPYGVGTARGALGKNVRSRLTSSSDELMRLFLAAALLWAPGVVWRLGSWRCGSSRPRSTGGSRCARRGQLPGDLTRGVGERGPALRPEAESGVGGPQQSTAWTQIEAGQCGDQGNYQGQRHNF